MHHVETALHRTQVRVACCIQTHTPIRRTAVICKTNKCLWYSIFIHLKLHGILHWKWQKLYSCGATTEHWMHYPMFAVCGFRWHICCCSILLLRSHIAQFRCFIVSEFLATFCVWMLPIAPSPHHMPSYANAVMFDAPLIMVLLSRSIPEDIKCNTRSIYINARACVWVAFVPGYFKFH